MSDDTDTEATPADITTGIRTELATIRRHWHATANPSRGTGPALRLPSESRLPGSVYAISLRTEVTLDLAFWVHALLDEHPVACQPTTERRVPIPALTYTTTWSYVDELASLDCTDVPAMCDYLSRHASVIATWGNHGHRLWGELIDHARDVKHLARPPVRDTMPLGECDCGEVVRAKAHDPGNIKCKGCGVTDTIDGWIIRIVGNEPLVTAQQLIPVLHKRMGIVASREQIRQWKHRGTIIAVGQDDRGRTVFDRKAVFLALSRWEHQREATA